MADIEKVLETSVEVEKDGTLKHRFEPTRDGSGVVTALRVCQGHGKYVQTLLRESAYMTPASLGDPHMTDFLLHGTKRRNVAGIWKYGLIKEK